MLLTSTRFIVFLVISLIVYFVAPKRIQWVVLLVISYVFYAFAGLKLISFLVLTTVTTYGAGIIIEKIRTQSKLAKALESATSKKEKKLLKDQIKRKMKYALVIVLLINFGILAFLKYYNVFVANINFRLENVGEFALPIIPILIPLGISFYIFQSMGYIIDVFIGRYKPETNLFRFALFVSFFPQIIQGPISRFNQLANQLYAPHNFDFDRFKFGMQLILWGYFKKIIIADRTAVVVNQIINNYTDYTGSTIAFGILFYCIQIYCDFSGGIDIVRGIAQIMGIDMVENFKRPYFATSLADYWRRWHISLGTWMKDYVFYPLSLSKTFFKFNRLCRKTFKGNFGKIFPGSIITFIVFFAIGIWHGASFKYIAFGIWNGTIITFSLIAEPLFKKTLSKLHINGESLYWKIWKMIRTSILVFIGRYFTRGGSFIAALSMLKSTVLRFGPLDALRDVIPTLGLKPMDYYLIIMGCFVLFIVGIIQEKGTSIRMSLEKQHPMVQWGVLMLVLVVLVVFGIYREGYISSEFIYMQF